jgi:exopolysaccharide biosynthesis WecB/TagA/CpsF family protein
MRMQTATPSASAVTEAPTAAMPAVKMPVRIAVLYPSDPLGHVPGGIDTFIRGILKWAPSDLQYTLIGATADPIARPLWKLSTINVGGRAARFLPIVTLDPRARRSLYPLTLRYLLALRKLVARGGLNAFDILDFHRIEPGLLFLKDPRPQNVVLHQDMSVLHRPEADIMWRYAPGLYDRLERRVFENLQRVFAVRESAVQRYRETYPASASKFSFIPTWVDTSVFRPVDGEFQSERAATRERLRLRPDAEVLIFVGRLDRQKDPLLLFSAFLEARKQRPGLQLLIVGDGILRDEIEHAREEHGVQDDVHLLGPQPPAQIARLLRASDVFVLSSAYEGMPIAVLEALASGVPVASTDVGEIRRVVRDGISGKICTEREPKSLAAAICAVLIHREAMRGEPCMQAVADFNPENVLRQIYENHRQQAEAIRSQPPQRVNVLDSYISACDTRRALVLVEEQLASGQGGYVCFTNAHTVVMGLKDRSLQAITNRSFLSLADGRPVYWVGRHRSRLPLDHVPGPDFFIRALRRFRNRKHFFYGSTPEVLERLVRRLEREIPGLQICGALSPPFRPLTPAEMEEHYARIRESGAEFVWVGLGAPKQERWMAESWQALRPCILFGVGAAFDFHAGTLRRAPVFMQHMGLEWLHRLASEPRRLWRRYLITNSLFLCHVARNMLGRPRGQLPSGEPR